MSSADDLPTEALPAALGYRWPAEWEPHAATWIAWPRNPDTWPGKFEVIPPQFARFARTLAEFETVHILAGGDEVMASAQEYVGGAKNIVLHDIPTNDCWTRDYGPTFLASPPAAPPALIDWQYNAWGGKYPPWDHDNAVPQRIAELTGRRRFAMNLKLEGGSIDGNGAGTILTTETCLLNPSRNEDVSRQQIERVLADCLGAKKVLWLSGRGIAGDDTDGHIDQLARFVDESIVVAACCNDHDDENHDPLAENIERLMDMTDQDGRPLTVIPLGLPRRLYYNDQRLPASYCNFYIANGAVLVPQFDDPADETALATLGDLFPERRIIGLPALDFVWGLGAFHCATQQEPAAPLAD